MTMSAAWLACVLPLLLQLAALLPSPAAGQTYLAATITGSLAYAPSAAVPLLNTIEPTCLQDYRAVWYKNTSTPMWALSGGTNYVLDSPSQVFYSQDGFNTVTGYNNGAFLGRAGAAAVLVNGSSFPAGTLYTWEGLYGDDIGLFGGSWSFNNGMNWTYSDTVNIAPQSLFRVAYCVLPFTNYIIQAGGVDSGSFTTSFLGGNAVYYSSDQVSLLRTDPHSRHTQSAWRGPLLTGDSPLLLLLGDRERHGLRRPCNVSALCLFATPPFCPSPLLRES